MQLNYLRYCNSFIKKGKYPKQLYPPQSAAFGIEFPSHFSIDEVSFFSMDSQPTFQALDGGLKNANPALWLEDWAITDYTQAFEKQLVIIEERHSNLRPDTLIFTEHYPVFTVGARKNAHSHILEDVALLEQCGFQVRSTNRGGDVTYHGLGQLVVYPIISIAHTKDLHGYLRQLEQVIINTLGCLGLAASRKPGKTGVWLQDRKIAAIGVASKRWVTYHGFALNVNVDLEPFTKITPCGISPDEGTVTSMAKELGRSIDMHEVKKVVTNEFAKIFSKNVLSSLIQKQ
jgi:lipoyl(octanoyl) transferase